MARNIVVILLHAAVGVMLVLAFMSRSREVVTVEVVRTDTIHAHDTIRIAMPMYVERRIVDTIVVRDTLMREVMVLPREQRIYQDSNFRAVVSGFQPSLDSMNVYQQHRTVKVTEQITPPRWSLGLQGGVGITPKGVQPYIGIGISYRLDIK